MLFNLYNDLFKQNLLKNQHNKNNLLNKTRKN